MGLRRLEVGISFFLIRRFSARLARPLAAFLAEVFLHVYRCQTWAKELESFGPRYFEKFYNVETCSYSITSRVLHFLQTSTRTSSPIDMRLRIFDVSSSPTLPGALILEKSVSWKCVKYFSQNLAPFFSFFFFLFS